MIDSTTIVKYVARCDSCGLRHHTLDEGFPSEVHAIHLALTCGWTLSNDGTGIYCLDCSHGPVPEPTG